MKTGYIYITCVLHSHMWHVRLVCSTETHLLCMVLLLIPNSIADPDRVQTVPTDLPNH